MAVYDNNKIRGRIIEKFGSQKAFAESMEITAGEVSKKLSNFSSMTREDVEEWSAALSIQPDEIPAYFFAH